MAQVLNGRGFEYACLISLYKQLSYEQGIEILSTPTYLNAKLSYGSSDLSVQQNFDLAADAAIRVIRRLEPQLDHHQNNQPLMLTIQSDSRGMQGDVRDLRAFRVQNDWEIGLSAKHNHRAVKHSRLSKTIDFGKEWMGVSSSNIYFNEITTIFEELEELRRKETLWRQIDDKAERFYVPVLKAFMNELNRLNHEHSDIPSRLLSYLLGRKDFYKVIANAKDRTTEIQGYSMYGTLNRPSGINNPQIRLPRLNLPTRFYDVDFKPKSNTTLIIVCNEGWEISARIHNASSFVEPSLKFDIQLKGVPQNLYRHVEPWE